MLTVAYLALAVLGGGYIVVAAALGHLTDAGGHDAGGHGGGGDSSYGVDQGGHGHVTASDGAVTPFHFPFFSPLALATLFAAFGGYGLIALYGLQVGDGPSVAFAAPAALITAYAVTYLAHRIVTGSRGSSQIRLDRIVGAAGEVTTPIPANGLGEATVMVGAQRYSAPARDASGQGLPRGTSIVVQRMAGTTLVVSRREADGPPRT
jgi:membrane protein implicated in regulation of membrane protease activity